MAITETKLVQVGLTTDLRTVYTVPAGFRAVIKTFDLCNTGTVDRRGTMFFLPTTTGIPGSDNTIVPDVLLPGRTMLQWTGLQILNAGDKIQVQASGLGLTLNMSGAESEV